MELRHLRYFVAVADALNFTKAAQKLRVAQPALSRQIRQLEDELGVTLLERNRRSVRLTEAGRAFVEEARSILEHSAKAVQAAQATSRIRAGSLNVGYVWGLFHSMVPAALEQFRHKHPDSPVNLFDLTAIQQATALTQGELDLGFIGFSQEADAAGLAKAKVGSCSFVAALPMGHPAARKKAVELAALAHDSFFVISEQNYPGASKLVLDACARAGFRPKILQAVERGHTILGLVAGNCGVAVLPEPLRNLPHPGVVLRPLTGMPNADLVVAWQPARTSPLRDAFVSSCLEQIRPPHAG